MTVIKGLKAKLQRRDSEHQNKKIEIKRVEEPRNDLKMEMRLALLERERAKILVDKQHLQDKVAALSSMLPLSTIKQASVVYPSSFEFDKDLMRHIEEGHEREI